MGNYNPHAPVILGQQWVPIRDEDQTFTPIINTVEVGHTFKTTATTAVTEGRVYINNIPNDSDSGQNLAISAYPAFWEDLTGPIQSVIIPVNAVTLTGGSVSSAADAVSALYTPGDDGIFFTPASGTVQGLRASFNVGESIQALIGKRILGVRLLYAGAVSRDDENLAFFWVTPDIDLGPIWTDMVTIAEFRNGDDVRSADLGELNYWWNGSPTSPTSYMNWISSQLQRFDQTAQKLYVICACGTAIGGNATASDSLYIQYLAMEVFFCEERRVAFGDVRLSNSGGLLELNGRRALYGMLPVPMLNPTNYAALSLAAGDYTVVVSSPATGDVSAASLIDYPDLNAVRQLYEIPSHPGVQINIPFPLEERLGETFTKESSAILPQISLYTSGGPLTAPHVYGRQVAAQAWGLQTPIQGIYSDSNGGIAVSYPQVRYYARRFGDTTIPLTLTGVGVFAGSTASITVADFDELPEILDGWREVTLRFNLAPSMGAITGTPSWMWSALNEFAGNRWEILGASAPAISGVPGTLYQLAPPPNQLNDATYQPVGGTTAFLTWMPQGVASSWVTGGTADFASDAVLMFSTDPATITGISLTQLTQAVSGIGSLCGSLPCCIPSGIGYQQITWPMNGSTSLVRDSFDRTVVSGTGSPDVGGAYAVTDVPGAYNVTGDELTITPQAATVTAFATIDVGSPDFDITMETGVVGNIVAGSNARSYAVGRYTDANNWYGGLIQQTQSTGTTVIAITKTVTGVETVLRAPSSPLGINAGGRVWVRFMGSGGGAAVGTLLKFKIWNGQKADEPAFWHIEETDTSLTTGNRAGMGAQSRAVQGNVLAFDNLLITSPAYWFGAYELQRYDSVAGDFETIMQATDITTTSFNDFEARVGIPSVYRIRNINAYNFNGAWSTYVSGTPTAPGISMAGGCDNTGALIFTSNADQTGANNAAYVMQWESTPNESFDLFEADAVQFQPMYGRDGRVAFHGTERGLEEFSRVVLLQAGAIALPSLADAADIRDLAWADLPYVCVRDGRGNRWFSNVRVPNAGARNNAQNYMARLNITETTQVPYPVDP